MRAISFHINLIYLRFLLGLPKRTMLLFAIAGSTFVIGAFGLDLLVAYVGQSVDHRSMAFIGLDTLEKVLEMGGIILFVYALLSYMSSELKSIYVRFAEHSS